MSNQRQSMQPFVGVPPRLHRSSSQPPQQITPSMPVPQAFPQVMVQQNVTPPFAAPFFSGGAQPYQAAYAMGNQMYPQQPRSQYHNGTSDVLYRHDMSGLQQNGQFVQSVGASSVPQWAASANYPMQGSQYQGQFMTPAGTPPTAPPQIRAEVIQSTPVQPKAQKKSCALQIINPDTGKAVPLGPLSDTQSEGSSRSTPTSTVVETDAASEASANVVNEFKLAVTQRVKGSTSPTESKAETSVSAAPHSHIPAAPHSDIPAAPHSDIPAAPHSGTPADPPIDTTAEPPSDTPAEPPSDTLAEAPSSVEVSAKQAAETSTDTLIQQQPAPTEVQEVTAPEQEASEVAAEGIQQISAEEEETTPNSEAEVSVRQEAEEGAEAATEAPQTLPEEPFSKEDEVPVESVVEEHHGGAAAEETPSSQEEVAEDDKNVASEEDELEEGEIRDEDDAAEEKPKLRFKYKEGQWSPLNPSGYKQYDRDFLIQFRSVSNSVPKDLPAIPDIMRDDSGARDHGYMHMPMADFSPGYIRSSNSQRLPHRKSGQRGLRRTEPTKIIQINRAAEVQLKKTENPWMPTVLNKSSEEKSLERQVTLILNKITPEKFDKLMDQMKALFTKIANLDELRTVITLIHQKACQEPSYSVAYARMCRMLSSCKIQLSGEETATPMEGQPTRSQVSTLFRKHILTECQREFERELYVGLDVEKRRKAIDDEKDPEKKEGLAEELHIDMSKDRKRAVGNIKLVAELFKQQLLTEKIMHQVIKGLLKRNDDDKLEMLCMLLTTIGSQLDKDEAKNLMDQYFTRMKEIYKNSWCSPRLRFAILDVIELREHCWVSERQTAKPKTRQQLHDDRVLEEHKEKLELEDRRQASRNSTGRFPGDDGFTTVTRPVQSQKFDPNKMKLSKSNVDVGMRLGPGAGFSGWSKGGRGSAGAAPVDRAPTPQRNRFSALDGPGSSDDRSSAPRHNSRERPTPSRMSRGGSEKPGNMGPPVGRAPRTASGPRGGRDDRHGALMAARNFSREDQRATATRSRSRDGQKRQDGSRDKHSRNVQRQESAPAHVPAPALERSVLEKKVKDFIDEYLHSHELKEALLLTSELPPANMVDVVSVALEHVLEKNAKFREMTGKYLSELVGNRVISAEQFSQGLESVCEFAPDFEVDMPLVYDWLGELLAPLLQLQTLRLTNLRGALQRLRSTEGGKPHELLVGVLRAFSSHMGHIKATELLGKSNFKLKDYFKNVEEMEAYLKKKDALWLADVQPRRRLLSEPDTIKPQLHELLSVKHVGNEELFDWIEQHVATAASEPRFIDQLVTAVFTESISVTTDGAAKTNTTRLQDRFTVLTRYIDSKPLLELQALLAVETLVHQLHHPSDLLRSLFELMFEEELLSEDCFHQWREGPSTGAESRGVALRSVSSFFEWLKVVRNEDESAS